MSSALENEDLENVPLVRMEDVQPSRDRLDRAMGTLSPPTDDEEVYETCIIDDADYRECVIDDDSDSNIGSMVSIQSEEMHQDEEDSDGGELIVPEVLEPPLEVEIPTLVREDVKVTKPQPPNSWPTLEILPGGVIKNANDYESDGCPYPTRMPASTTSTGEMMYACAKCSQAFKYLFCLVKHVKWHEDQQKMLNYPNLKKLTPMEKELVYIKRQRNEIDKTYKKQKVEVMGRIAAAIGKMNAKELLNKQL